MLEIYFNKNNKTYYFVQYGSAYLFDLSGRMIRSAFSAKDVLNMKKRFEHITTVKN